MNEQLKSGMINVFFKRIMCFLLSHLFVTVLIIYNKDRLDTLVFNFCATLLYKFTIAFCTCPITRTKTSRVTKTIHEAGSTVGAEIVGTNGS